MPKLDDDSSMVIKEANTNLNNQRISQNGFIYNNYELILLRQFLNLKDKKYCYPKQ